MKTGDLVECRETKKKGFVVGIRTSIGGNDPIVRMSYSVEWLEGNLGRNPWLPAHTLKVIKSNE